jgi:hypothetical protein
MVKKSEFANNAVARVLDEFGSGTGINVFVSEDAPKTVGERLIDELVKKGALLILVKASDTASSLAKQVAKAKGASTVIFDHVLKITEDNISGFLDLISDRSLDDQLKVEGIENCNFLLIARSGDGYSFAILQRSNIGITEDEVVELSSAQSSDDCTYRFVLGYIPEDWNKASDGSMLIMVGDTDHSKSIEYTYQISDSSWDNVTTGNCIEGDMDDTYLKLSDDSEKLSSGKKVIPTYVFKNIYEFCLDEAESQESALLLVEEAMSQFTNSRKKYNGCFYCYYVSESDNEIVKEMLFVVKGS